MTKYRALTGLNLPIDEKEHARVLKLTAEGKEITDRLQVRYEAGEIPDYIPASSVKWLLEGGLIEEVKDG